MKKENKIAIIRSCRNDVFFSKIDNKNIYEYKTNTNIYKIWNKLKLPKKEIFYRKWLKKMNEYEIVIFFDNGFTNEMPKLVKKENQNIKIILWLWNPLCKYHNLYIKNNLIDEIWSYNKDDVEKYNFKYNNQFYSKYMNLEKRKEKYDVTFLGTAKNRKEDLLNIKEELIKIGLKVNFKIIENKKDFISYNEYLNILSESKLILDYNLPVINACTLRIMESLFFEKKIITNNKYIKEYDFYNPQNVFILEKNNYEGLKEFVETPYSKIDKKILDNYDFENWLKNFEVK